MKTFDESRAWTQTRSEEIISDRDEAIISRWKAARTLDMLVEIADSLLEGEHLTSDDLREVREHVAKLAAQKRAEIIREWEITRASEGEQ